MAAARISVSVDSAEFSPRLPRPAIRNIRPIFVPVCSTVPVSAQLPSLLYSHGSTAGGLGDPEEKYRRSLHLRTVHAERVETRSGTLHLRVANSNKKLCLNKEYAIGDHVTTLQQEQVLPSSGIVAVRMFPQNHQQLLLRTAPMVMGTKKRLSVLPLPPECLSLTKGHPPISRFPAFLDFPGP